MNSQLYVLLLTIGYIPVLLFTLWVLRRYFPNDLPLDASWEEIKQDYRNALEILKGDIRRLLGR